MTDTDSQSSGIMEILKPQLDVIRSKRAVRISVSEFSGPVKFADICNTLSELLVYFDPPIQLEKISVSNNELRVIPAEFYRLCGPQLRSLDMHGNKLTEIPRNIGEFCPNLEILDLSQNMISRMSGSALAGLRKLRFLSVKSNHVTHLPAALGEILSLETVEIAQNPLVFPSFDALQSMQGGTSELKAYLIAHDIYSTAESRNHRSENHENGHTRDRNNMPEIPPDDSHGPDGHRTSDESSRFTGSGSESDTRDENYTSNSSTTESHAVFSPEHTLDPRADAQPPKAAPATSPRPFLPSTPALSRTRSLSDTRSRSSKASRRMGLIINSNKVTPDKTGGSIAVLGNTADTPSKPARKLSLPNREKSDFGTWMEGTNSALRTNGSHTNLTSFAAPGTVANESRTAQKTVPVSPKSGAPNTAANVYLNGFVLGGPGSVGASEDFPADMFTETEQKPTAYFRRLSILQETPVESVRSRDGSQSSNGNRDDAEKKADIPVSSGTSSQNQSQNQSQSRSSESQSKTKRKMSSVSHTSRHHSSATTVTTGQNPNSSSMQDQNENQSLSHSVVAPSRTHEKAVVVKVSRKILFAFSELHLSIKRFAGFCGDRKLSSRILRLIHTSKEHIDDLVEAMEAVEEGKENQNSVVFFLHACIGSFKTILATISENFAALVAKIDACFIRMVLLTLYGSLHELQNAHGLLVPESVVPSSVPVSGTLPVSTGHVTQNPASTGSAMPTARTPATLTRNTSGLTSGASSADLKAKFAQASQGILDDMPLETPSISSAAEAVATLEEIDERLYQTIGSATDNAQVVFSELTKTISKSALASATGTSSSKNAPALSPGVTAKFKELTHVCMTSMEITKRLVGKLAAIRQSPDAASRRFFWDDINLFLKAVIQTFSAVKDIMRDAPIFNEVRWSMANLTKTTKELTIVLEASSYKAISDAVETQNGNNGSSDNNKSSSSSSSGMWHMSSGPPASANASASASGSGTAGALISANASANSSATLNANSGINSAASPLNNAANGGSSAATPGTGLASALTGPGPAGIPAVRTPLVATVGTAAAQALLAPAPQIPHAKTGHVTAAQLPPLNIPPSVFSETSSSGLHTAPVQSMEQYYAKNVNPFDRM